ncbi:MAG: sigma-70 family RNA polymerase sigma factor [Geodermatophilaceae bacterium]|nr:sigma-70 family RNA polymerase sigma factor [Geodermatophilaceae bacterium]
MRTSAPVRTTTDGGDVEVGIAQQFDEPPEPDADGAADTQREQTTAAEDTPWDAATRYFRAWRDGDRAVLEEFVRRVSPILWQVVRSYGLDQASAEDVVQTTWMTLIRKSEQVRDDRAVLRWLTVTARREAWRTAQQRSRANPTEDTVIEMSLPPARSTESEVLETVAQRSLWQNVGKLDERCQHLLRVVAFQERPDYATLATQLDMPIGSIGPTRSRCLSKLRTLMASDDGSRL